MSFNPRLTVLPVRMKWGRKSSGRTTRKKMLRKRGERGVELWSDGITSPAFLKPCNDHAVNFRRRYRISKSASDRDELMQPRRSCVRKMYSSDRPPKLKREQNVDSGYGITRACRAISVSVRAEAWRASPLCIVHSATPQYLTLLRCCKSFNRIKTYVARLTFDIDTPRQFRPLQQLLVYVLVRGIPGRVAGMKGICSERSADGTLADSAYCFDIVWTARQNCAVSYQASIRAHPCCGVCLRDFPDCR
nr:hypothetical protein CFP56_12223 [Quercus suber]